MKLSDIKAQIDAYFDRTSPEEIVRQLEEQGCEFEEVEDFYWIETSNDTFFANVMPAIDTKSIIEQADRELIVINVTSEYGVHQTFDELLSPNFATAA